ncbi:hypothetical protein LXJ56_27055, partial [Escherichia coli]|nr:hypothetical protein [Escherichia coli]
GLALHELIANAGQFGALGDADGRLTIRWWMQETQPVPVLHLDWREDLTGTTIAAPDHEGFGLELLTRSLRYEIDAEVTLDFRPEGLHAVLRIPLVAAHATAG